ncbi:n(4)--l-asparaginase [Pseudoneurospora amorphoporcata]|uniref:N(4)--l-asparaginase n=1 Tax=Pseudoneurospora amorphoporcata TaxID=241081 RepID=A0AAN6NM62_9PEZI|nr:n(4)--l-asparaginase [Pseudoneurospora amorphoporcata]
MSPSPKPAPLTTIFSLLALLASTLASHESQHPISSSSSKSNTKPDWHNTPGLPFVINTWGGTFTSATNSAFHYLSSPPPVGSDSNPRLNAINAIVAGCSTCERLQCDGTVGYGGSPDESCETTLDALLMDGDTLDSGAVANLRRVRDAIAVAKLVLLYTGHSLLTGDQATGFAKENGFKEEDSGTKESRGVCEEWKREGCKTGSYRRNNVVGSGEGEGGEAGGCGPYVPVPEKELGPDGGLGETEQLEAERSGHDTISMIAIGKDGRMAAGSSTNGASHKIPGRVGDGPIVGSGAYVDGEVGGCGASGDGDIMMRFLPCYQAVESLRRRMTPAEAAEDVVRRMVRKYPSVQSGIVVVDKDGNHGAAASGWTFTYAYRGGQMSEAVVVTVPPVEGVIPLSADL